ncbi:hypothetical protein ES703_87192 [subsurface metagenome]
MKKLLTLIVILLMLLSVILTPQTGCNSEPDELDGTQWSLIEINGNELIEDSYISLYFRDEGVWGCGGCNIYYGDYSTEDPNILRIPGVGRTEEGCISPEGVLEQEAEYWDAITDAAFYSIADNKLEIDNAMNQKLLVFEKIEELPMNPADLVGTGWQLVSMNGEQILEGLSITLVFDSDSVATGRAGCFSYRLDYTASGDDIRWGTGSWRSGELPQELENQALSYTDIIAKGANYRLTAERLEILTAKGDIMVYNPMKALD